MSILGALKNLGKAAVGSALIPVDAFADLVTGFEKDRVARRIDYIETSLDNATEESYDGESE